MRRWRGLRLRRGAFFTGAARSPVPAVPPPQAIRQAGWRPRLGARLLPASRRRLDPAWPQASQGQAWPSFGRQSGSRARPFGARLRRGAFLPVPPQVISAVPPQPVRGSRPHRAPLRVPRSHLWGPALPQAGQGQPWAYFTRQAGSQPRGARLRRGAFLAVPPPALPGTVPQAIRGTRARAIARPPRGRLWGPALPQGNQGQAWASLTRARPRLAVRPRRGVFLAVPQSSLPLPVPQAIRGARPRPPLRAPRGRVQCSVLAQASQGAPFPSLTRQAGTRRRPWARRGVFLAVPSSTAPPPSGRGLLMAGWI